MLSLDQVRLLENRVENTHVRSQLSGLQARVNELEGLVRSFKDDQGRIEEGILNALDRLSAFEDSVYQASETTENTLRDKTETDVLETIEESVSSTPEIEADWQNPVGDSPVQVSVSDGQMDIF
jgi:chromosome segregation ATPase